MNREELARELDVQPWDVDDWLLGGCPAAKIRMQWEFDLQEVLGWLKEEGIRVKRIKPGFFLPRPPLDHRWFGKRCPICTDRGFSGDHAGRLYSFGEIFEGRWHLRRTGIPCGHSQNLTYL
jgi:hypothetical protein